MIKLCLTFLFISISTFILAQQNPGNNENQLYKDTIRFTSQPLFVLKQTLSATLITTNIVINANDIDSINVIKNAGAADLYAETNRNGVVELVLKNTVKLITYEQLMSTFHIPNSEINLPVYIDSAIAFKPKNTYFQLSAIKSVSVAIEESTGDNYISVLTIHPFKHSMKNGVSIIGSAGDIKIEQ